MSQRIYIIWSNSIFHESLRVLLRHPDVSIVGDSSDISGLAQAIRSSHANVLLFEDLEDNLDKGIVELLKNDEDDLHIVSLSLNDNHLLMVNREKRSIQQSGDLLQFVLAIDHSGQNVSVEETNHE